MFVQRQPTDREGYWLSMPGGSRKTLGLVRILDSGDMEIELYDERPGTTMALGRAHSVIYSIGKEELQTLAERLAEGFGGPVAGLSELPEQLVTFLNVQSLIEWVVGESGVGVARRVDFNEG